MGGLKLHIQLKQLLMVIAVTSLLTVSAFADSLPSNYQQVAVPGSILPAGSQVTVNSTDITNPTFLQMIANLGKYIMNAFIPAKTASNEKVYIPKDSFNAPAFEGEQVVELTKPVQTYKAEARVTTEEAYSEVMTKHELSDAINKAPGMKSNDCVTESKSKQTYSAGWSQYIASIERVGRASNVNPKALNKTLDYLKNLPPAKQAQLKNRRYVTISDLSMKLFTKRMAVLDLETGTTSHYEVAHGEGLMQKNGRRLNNPELKACSAVNGSNMSPPGFHVINSVKTKSKFGRALYMNGLESRNQNSFMRNIIFHGANVIYSQGCPMLDPADYSALEQKLKGGSLYYNFCPQDW